MGQKIEMMPISATELQSTQEGYKVDLKYGLEGRLNFKGREVKVVWYGIEPTKMGGSRGELYNHLAVGGVLFCDGDCRSGGVWAYGSWAGTPSSADSARPTLKLEGNFIKWTFPQGGDEELAGEGLDVQYELNNHDTSCKKRLAKSSTSWGTYGVVALVVIGALGYIYRERVGTFLNQYR